MLQATHIGFNIDIHVCQLQNSRKYCKPATEKQNEVILQQLPEQIEEAFLQMWTDSSFQFLNSKTVFHSVKPNAKGAEVTFVCSQEKDRCSCPYGNTCKGDRHFCETFNCTDHASCFCKTENTTAHWSIAENGAQYTDVKLVEITWKKAHNRRHKRHMLSSQDGFEVPDTQQEEEEAQALFKKNEITVAYLHGVFTVNTKGVLIIRSQGVEQIYEIKKDKTQVTIPQSILKKDEHLKFIFINVEGKVLKGQILVEESTFCRRINCVLCWEFVRNQHCIPNSLRYTIVCFAAILTSITAIYLRSLMVLLFQCITTFFFIIKQTCRLAKSLTKLSLVTGAAVGHKTKGKMQDLKTYIEASKPKPSVQTVLVILALVAMAMAEKLDCTDSQVLHTQIEECREQNDVNTCKISTHLQVTLKNIQHTTCLFLKGKQDQNLVQLKLKLKEVSCRFQTERLYYTFTSSFSPVSELFCAQNEFCSWGLHCHKNKDFPALTHQMKMFSGPQGCQAITLAGACIISDSQHCMFYKHAIIPNLAEAYEVRKIISYTCAHTLEIEENSENSTQEQVIQAFGTTKTGIKINIQGQYQGFNTVFSEPYLIVRVADNQEAYIEQVAEPGRPQKGLIGDIQSNSSYTTKILFDPDSIRCEYYEELYSCEFYPSYLEQLQKSDRRLPRAIGFHHLFTDADGVLKSNLLSSPPLVVHLTFQGYKVTLKTSKSCPNFKDNSIAVEGCFKCFLMPKLSFSALSNCEAGTISVTATGVVILTPAIYLEKKPITFYIAFRSEVRCPKGRLCLSSQTMEKCLKFSFCLKDPDLFINFPNTSSTRLQHPSYGSSQWNSLDFLPRVRNLVAHAKTILIIFTTILISVFCVQFDDLVL